METSLFLAKLIGLYAVIMGLLWGLRGSVFRQRIADCMDQSAFLFLSGFMALLAGLAIIVGHNVWEANWRVAITIVGYLSLAKGVVLLACPEHLMQVSRFFLKTKGSILYVCLVIPLGAWLAWIGFTAG